MWYIGQEIVCIEEDAVVYGKIYTVLGIKTCCNEISLEINEPRALRTHCFRCKTPTGGRFFVDELFAPLDSLMKEEIAELMKCDEVFGVKINLKYK